MLEKETDIQKPYCLLTVGNTFDNTIGFDFQSVLNFVWIFYIKLSHTLWTHSHSCIMFRHVKISNVQAHLKIF